VELGRPDDGSRRSQAPPLRLCGADHPEPSIPLQAEALIPDAIQRLVKLYEAMDKTAEAAKWRKELAAVKTAAKGPSQGGGSR
jgi:hypothetical protein